MICNQCRLINPSDNLFCQNCGAPIEQPTLLASPAFTKANTMDNNSILLSRNHWLVGWDAWFPFLMASLAAWMVKCPWWGWSLLVLLGLVLAWKIAGRHQQIEKLSIPVELMDQQIIAYGPANTSNRWFLPAGVLYLLANGVFYKTVVDRPGAAFHHVQLAAVTKVNVHTGPSWMGDWQILCVHIGSERKLRFVVYKSAAWMALFHMVRKTSTS